MICSSFKAAPLVALLGTALPATPLLGQAPEGAPPAPAATSVRLSLAETVERALGYSARLAQLSALEAAADAGVRGARAGRLPQVDVSASYVHDTLVPVLTIQQPGTGPQRIQLNFADRYRARAGLTLPVYTGGRVEGGIAAAQHSRDAAARDRDGGVNDLALEASTAYWQLVTARESVRVLTEALASFEAHLKDTRDREEYGMAARNEVLAVQVERDGAELNRLVAANAAAVTNADLLRLVGLPPGTLVEPSEPPTVAPAPEPDVESLVAEALACRPEADALRSRIAAAEATVKVARSASRPQAGLTAGYDYAQPNQTIVPPVTEWKGTWNVGVSVSLTAFDGGRTSAAAAQARAQAEAVRHLLVDVERRIRLEVTSRVLNLGAARAAVAVAERTVESALENVRVTGDRYREGLVPSAERLDAETALLRAGLDEISAVSQLHLAQANLKRAVGR